MVAAVNEVFTHQGNPLTVEEKQDIFYDNAAKFLGLTAEEISRHHR